MKILAGILIISLLTGCKSRPTGPVPIASDDACASCRMLISERRFAAELLDDHGTIYKFDDIACMMRFAQTHGKNSASATFYVTDYAGGRDWLDARQAHFVRLPSNNSSPMASGLAAFRNAKDAAASLGSSSEHVLSFNDLWANAIHAQTMSMTGSHSDTSRRVKNGN